jgi:uncharacterized membrane protein YfcA
MLLITKLLAYLATGCAAGYLAGLFGVGGGIVVVPVLVFMFEWMGFPPDVIMQLAIGTSMATVAVTAVFSARTHHCNGNVDWHRVKLLMPVVLIGVITGAFIGAYVSRNVLAGSVVAFEIIVAGWFIYETIFHDPKANLKREPAPVSSFPVMGISSLLGAVSSVVGIAGGTLFVPLFNFCGVAMRQAIGTAAIPTGTPSAAAVVYLFTGVTAPRLPAYSAGYVYLPAFVGCVMGSIWTTKHGADLAKKMNVRNLKLAFALVLLVAAGKMLWGLLHP